MNKAAAKEYLRLFDFKALFLNELGWDDHDGSLPLKVCDETITLDAVAEKRGMAAYLCALPEQGRPYDYQTRCKIEIQLAKSVREHLIVYFDAKRRFQTWQWVKREHGKPIARREHTLTAGQSGEALLQKLEALEVKIEEDEQLTLVGITARARHAFDVDRVTKRFYDRFKTEHAAFLKQIEGIDDEDECEWYASIMLNRLKFVYFIQKKGFLDQDKDYLRNRLAMVQKTRPKTKFLSFYRAFLLKLFHDGLGRKERSAELRDLLGTVPYLNGGIFAVHPLEEKHTGIDIPDKAFEKVFAFFDQYRWHLDERPLRADDEINPDVLGYIFEKYINQKQMGAYYTKEDITEYIAKNCIVPFILDRVESDLKKKPDAFRSLFQLLAADPDRYIYDPVKHGVELSLPAEIEKGVDSKKPNLLERRDAWNKAAPSEHALPTEIWREVVARRQRCAELRDRLSAISSESAVPFQTNDLITLNLNIRQFAQDCIENAAAPEVLWAFWQAIEQITVLDPTCGSGAFLFAAVNVLEPLYEACLDRMKAFMLEWSQAQKVPHPNYYKDFAAVIARVEKHANEKYFIFKSIIIRNLYGVDIMDEAVEICKLRLFLKLAAQLEPDYAQDNLGIEPLPDIDFNVRAGNTLVGFATEKQAEDVIRQDLLGYNTVWPEVQKEAQEIAEMFALFRQQQTELGGAVSVSDKKSLRAKLAPLEDRLNAYLADTYGVTAKKAIKDWVHSHKPFHWFIEFYEIMAKGGFNVIIGNPPYLDMRQLTGYRIVGYRTLDTKNLYSLVLERCTHLTHGRMGYIVPISSTSTEGYLTLQEILRPQDMWFASFDDRPAHLFDGLDKNTLSILLLSSTEHPAQITSSRLNRWAAEERPALFALIQNHQTPKSQLIGSLPRIGSSVEDSIWSKLFATGQRVSKAFTEHGDTVYYSRKVNAFLQVLDFVPEVRDGKGKKRPPSEFKELTFATQARSAAIFCLFNSTLFRWFIDVVSDGSHLNRRETDNFPFDPSKAETLSDDFRRLATKLAKDLVSHSFTRTMTYTHDTLTVQCIVPKHSKPIIDEIDRALAKHYGFTDEELDFIINYDIKYRMGRDGGEEESL